MACVNLATHVVELVTDQHISIVWPAMLDELSMMMVIDIVDATVDTWISAHVSAPIAVQQELRRILRDIVHSNQMSVLLVSTSPYPLNFQTK